MTLDELDRACRDQREAGLERLQLVLPARWKAPAGFPRRELACVNAAGAHVVWVRVDRLAAWVERARREVEA